MDMKTTDKNEKSRNVLPFAVVQKATEGDIVSINKVLKHYEGYISCLSVRKMYDKYGWYKEGIISVTMSGKEGAEKIKNIMNTLRANPPKEINGIKATILKDFDLQVETNILNGEKSTINLPKSDVIQVILEDGTHITARPSGTEPKIKYYFGVNAKDEKSVEEKMEAMKKAFTEIVK